MFWAILIAGLGFFGYGRGARQPIYRLIGGISLLAGSFGLAWSYKERKNSG
jgi:hypothetical protein